MMAWFLAVREDNKLQMVENKVIKEQYKTRLDDENYGFNSMPDHAGKNDSPVHAWALSHIITVSNQA